METETVAHGNPNGMYTITLSINVGHSLRDLDIILLAVILLPMFYILKF